MPQATTYFDALSDISANEIRHAIRSAYARLRPTVRDARFELLQRRVQVEVERARHFVEEPPSARRLLAVFCGTMPSFVARSAADWNGGSPHPGPLDRVSWRAAFDVHRHGGVVCSSSEEVNGHVFELGVLLGARIVVAELTDEDRIGRRLRTTTLPSLLATTVGTRDLLSLRPPTEA